MAEPSRRAVVLWIIQNLNTLQGSLMEPILEWITNSWGSFFQDATLEEVKSTNIHFDPITVLSFLSVGQLVEFIGSSDALVNVTTMGRVLSSLEAEPSETPLAKLEEFLTEFNLAIEQGYIPGFRNAEVKSEVLGTVFTKLARYFDKFSPSDYQSWFQSKLRFLLAGINEDLLQLIPLDLEFPSYTAIFGGFDQVYPDLPQETSRQIYHLMRTTLEHKVNTSGTPTH
ncbi:uncharacterized protein LOC144584726 [Pogona vitticeps]